MGKSLIISSHSKKFTKQQIDAIKKDLGLDKKNFADIFIVKQEEKLSIGIQSIKFLKEWAIVKPYHSKNKLAIIQDASLLTEEAQNSTLKLLEEPSQSLNLVLTCSNYQDLLPTVISRCQIISDMSEEIRSVIDFLSLDLANKFIYIRKIVENRKKTKNTQEIHDFLINLLYCYRENLLNSAKMDEMTKMNRSSFNIKLIQETERMLNANVMPKLALENLVVNLK